MINIGLGINTNSARLEFGPGSLFGAGDNGDFLDPNVLSSMTIARDGTGPAPGVGDVVGRIIGQRNGLIFEAPSDAARGILRESNGKFRIETDGVDDAYTCSTVTGFESKTTVTLAIWAHSIVLTDSQVVIGLEDAVSADTNKLLIIGNNTSLIRDQIFYNGSHIIDVGGAGIGTMRSLFFVQRAATDHTLYREGTSIGTSAVSKTTTATPGKLCYGGWFIFGLVSKSFLGAAVFINRGLTVAEVNALHTWGIGRYGA